MRRAELIEARVHSETGDIDGEELREIGDLSNRDVVRLQEHAGLEIMTDSEYRRNTYLSNLFERMGSLEFDHNA